MRFYHLLNVQHVMIYVFPTLVFILMLALSLAYACFKTKASESRKKTILYDYPDGLQRKNGPFPVVMMLVIVGTIAWAVGYIFMAGFMEGPL